MQQRALVQQQQADAAFAAGKPAPISVEEPTPPYGPGGTERPRLLTDIVTAVASPGMSPDQITERAQALIEWIDNHD